MKKKKLVTTEKAIIIGLMIVTVVVVFIIYFVVNVRIEATPATAQQILNEASAGDTILLVGGVYSNLVVSNSGTADEEIRIMCTAEASITGDNFGILLDGDYLELYGCEIKDVREHAILSRGKHIVIENNIVHDNVTENGVNGDCTLISGGGWASGISIKDNNDNTIPSSDDVIVRNNTVYHNCGEGIASTRTANVMVENNFVYDNYGVNIYIDNSFFNTVRKNIVNCSEYVLRDEHLAYGIGTGQEQYSGWGQQLHDISILENTVSGCFDGISIYATHGSASNILVDGNVVSLCDRYAITNRAMVTNMVVSNNQYCAEGGMSFIPLEGVTLINNIPITSLPIDLTPR